MQPGCSGSTPSEGPQSTFESFDFNKNLMRGIESVGFTSPTAIQSEAIPVILNGRDVLARAETGSGKTGAFVMPMLESFDPSLGFQGLVMVPTRELAEQVEQEFLKLGKFCSIKTQCIIGGRSMGRQIEGVRKGAHFIIATPGRLVDHLKSETFKDFAPKTIVIDEADEMLDMGFVEDIRSIIKAATAPHQTLMFSATFPRAIENLARDLLNEPTNIALNDRKEKNANIEQRFYMIGREDRDIGLLRLLQAEIDQTAIVFCRTKLDCRDVSEFLVRKKISAEALHGDMTQQERNNAISRFKKGTVRVLVATDVASRGIDVKDLGHVINYQIPENRDRYTHRIGRTGRAGNKGIASSLVTPHEFEKSSYLQLKDIQSDSLWTLPTASQVTKIKLDALKDRIIRSTVDEELTQLLDQLIEEVEPEELLLKCLSILRDRKPVTGPELIGFPTSKARQMLSRMIQRRGSGGRFGDRRRGNGRGRPSGGSGRGRHGGQRRQGNWRGNRSGGSSGGSGGGSRKFASRG